MDRLIGALDALTLLPLLASGDRRAVGWNTMGAFLVILGVAAVLPEWGELTLAPASFVAVSAGFVWLGLACIVMADVRGAERSGTLSIMRLGAVARWVAYLAYVAVILF